MRKTSMTKLGDAIFSSIDNNDFLNVLYDNMLYNYAIRKLNIVGYQTERPVDVDSALRFADLLSKSTHPIEEDNHKMWAQAIITLLLELYPKNEDVAYYAGAVLSNIGNFRGVELSRSIHKSKYLEANLQEKAFSQFMNNYLSIPAEQGKKFFISQKKIYDRLDGSFFSYSAPTSMGKSFIMEVFIKEQVKSGAKLNFARIVPTKALINEIREDTVNSLGALLEEKNYSVVTSGNDYALEENHNFILVMTPERLLYLLIKKTDLRIDYIFIDEAHKMTGKNKRGPFYYRTVDILAQRKPMPHFIFAAPNIPNPDVYLQLVTDAQRGEENALSSTFAPVTQFKFLVSHESQSICIFNDHTKDSSFVCKGSNDLMSAVSFMNHFANLEQNKPFNERKRHIAYFNSKDAAIAAAIDYSAGKNDLDDSELLQLSRDIEAQIHKSYYLAALVRKGIAYHIGHLPSSIRQRIERLFKVGKITAMFCTSTLIEGVNLPADNLFISNCKNGNSKMTSVDFRNLIGRVGRIKFNLYGNVFFLSDGKKATESDYMKLLRESISEQKLSVTKELKPKLKRHIVNTLLTGTAKIEPYKDQSNEEYIMMRKFCLILLKDIMDNRNSLVRREFAKYMPGDTEQKIREQFLGQQNFIDHDINISSDQAQSLFSAIRQGVKYPQQQNGHFEYAVVLRFLEELCRIFNWDRYEAATLGKKNNSGEHAQLRWYAVILCRWMEGHGLNHIMRKALEYMQHNPNNFWVNNYTRVPFNDSDAHRNIVFADTLEAIENVILFSISNYFLRFSNMYLKIHGEHSLDDNNWYEFVEYGTTDSTTVFLQRNGFSRESANYIKDHMEYIAKEQDGSMKLRRSLLMSEHNDAREEAKLILLNRPQVFENP